MAAGRDWDLVPLLWASAEPAGRVSDEAFERIVRDDLRRPGRKPASMDGVYLDLHGAMVTESHDDGEGEILRRVQNCRSARICRWWPAWTFMPT